MRVSNGFTIRLRNDALLQPVQQPHQDGVEHSRYSYPFDR
jgi:hypothetical protein